MITSHHVYIGMNVDEVDKVISFPESGHVHCVDPNVNPNVVARPNRNAEEVRIQYQDFLPLLFARIARDKNALTTKIIIVVDREVLKTLEQIYELMIIAQELTISNGLTNLRIK